MYFKLSVSWESNIPIDYNFNVNKYYDLTEEITKNCYKNTIEVGARNFREVPLPYFIVFAR